MTSPGDVPVAHLWSSVLVSISFHTSHTKRPLKGFWYVRFSRIASSSLRADRSWARRMWSLQSRQKYPSSNSMTSFDSVGRSHRIPMRTASLHGTASTGKCLGWLGPMIWKHEQHVLRTRPRRHMVGFCWCRSTMIASFV